MMLSVIGILLLVKLALCADESARPAASSLTSSSFGLPGQNATFDYVVGATSSNSTFPSSPPNIRMLTMPRALQIVGGGTAGLTTAMRLAANGTISVAVVEAGGFYQFNAGNMTEIPAYESSFLSAPPSIDWKIMTTPQAVRSIQIASAIYH